MRADPGQYATDANLAARIAIHGYSINPVPWRQWYLGSVPFAPGLALLDIGCGNGSLWRDNEALIDAESTITLADESPGMVEAARDGLAGAGPNWRFMVARVEALPFEDDSFDIVMANHMLYHAEDLATAISELARVVRPNGTVLASTNGQGHMAELRAWVVDMGIDADRHLQDHIRQFGLENGADLLRRAFGRVELRRHEDSLAVPEIDPVMNYIQSMQPPEDAVTEARLAALRERLQALLAEEGVIRIGKESGLFVATLPR